MPNLVRMSARPIAVRRGLLRLLAAFALTPALLAIAAPPAASAASESLAITGAVRTPTTFTVADLQRFDGEQVEQSAPRPANGKDAPSTVRGVRLAALLERAGLAGDDRNAWKHAVVVASGTDGYAVTFSWPELVDTDVGPGVIVVFERDGKPLDEREGRIALVSAKDLRPGPRNVHWLSRVDVRILVP